VNLDEQTILVTGATGYIGGRLAERLARETKARVRVLARTPAKAAWLAELGCEVAIGDVTDPASIQQAMQGCTLVYHAAAWVSERGQRAEVWAVNVTGTQTVLDAAIAARVARFVQISSCGVYGSLQRHGIDETTPMRKTGDLYSDSKVDAEELVWQAHRDHGLPIVIARPSQVYGLGSPQFTLRPLRMIRKGQLVLIDGGRHLCKPIYIDNLVDGLLLCGSVDDAIGHAFNFADPQPQPWRIFFGAYAEMLGCKRLPSVPFAVAWVGAALIESVARLRGRPAPFNRRVVRTLHSNNSFDCTRAQQYLGWQPRVGLEEGMKRTAEWLHQNGLLDEHQAVNYLSTHNMR
jgi:nucleoside-diphosphate-sugar epimerase